MTQRLIETWLPIAQLGTRACASARPMTPFPAPNRLHVWWARRPLVASRAAILASLLPADADREKFMHVLGIHGDPVAAKKRIDQARRKGERFEGERVWLSARVYLHARPTPNVEWILRASSASRREVSDVVLDPTAGGGSHPVRGDEAWSSDVRQ